MPSSCSIVRCVRGLSLWTNTTGDQLAPPGVFHAPEATTSDVTPCPFFSVNPSTSSSEGSRPLEAMSAVPRIMLAIAMSLLSRVFVNFTSGWCLENAASHAWTAPRNGVPTIRMVPPTLRCGWYAGKSPRSHSARQIAALASNTRNMRFMASLVRSKSGLVAPGPLQLRALARNDRGAERQVLAVMHDFLLALAADDEAQELLHQRIHGRSRGRVHVERVQVDPWIGAIARVLDGQLHVRAAGLLREVEHFLSGLLVFLAVVGEGDGIRVGGHCARDEVAADDALSIGPRVVARCDDVLVPLVAALQDAVGEIQRRVVAQVEPVHVDRLISPLAGEAELAPRAGIFFGAANLFLIPYIDLPSPPALRA